MEDECNDLQEAKELTAKDNMLTMRKLVKDWNLGPAKAYDNNIGNNKFWKGIAGKWSIDEAEARRRHCGNCEYGKIEPEYLEAMEHIPYNKYDRTGGQRVWCDKFKFICHMTRTCMAWED